MRVIILIFFTLMSFIQTSLAQPRHDRQWMLGIIEGSLLDFNSDTISFFLIEDKTLRQDGGTASMCNEVGQLIFYSNGCRIANAAHDIMENGEGLSEGSLLDFFCAPDQTGQPIPQTLIALPYPNRPNEYDLIYQDLASIGAGSQNTVKPLHLQYAKINMSANNGLGMVEEKNEVIIEDTLAMGYLQSFRHANGRDWWIICPEGISNCYYSVLLSPEGFEVIGKQCLGFEWTDDDVGGQSSFSKDGARYLRFHADNGLDVFDFDRCTGELSNPVHISALPDTSVICSGTAISPSGRFAYTTTSRYLYQFDLEAADIAATKILIAEWDGTLNPNPTNFCMAELAPDGKIYIGSWATTFNLHVIHEPDSLGMACNFIQRDFSVESDITNGNLLFQGLPSHPNYAIGTASGSPCDTILLSQPTAVLYCYPDSLNAFTFHFYDISPNNPDSWLWDFGDDSTSVEKNPVHFFPGNGTYEVCLTVSNAVGVDSVCKTIVLQITGLKEVEEEGLSVYPNPVHTMLYVKHPEIARWNKIALLDMTGRVLQLVEDQSELSIKELSDGLYFVHLESPAGGHYVRKVVVMNPE
jgi:PKD domain/Secretion system C-terminal sorting domain